MTVTEVKAEPAKKSAKAFLTSNLAYGLLAVLSLLYMAVTLLTPLSKSSAAYHISNLEIRLLQLTIVLPAIAIWFVALWGSLVFKRYAMRIEQNEDGRALSRLATGLLTLVTSITLTSVIQSFSQLFLRWGHLKAWVIFGNYVAVITLLAAFILIYQGAKQLARLVQFQSYGKRRWWILGALLVMGIVYVWVLAQNPYRMSSPDPGQVASYYLPDWLLLPTVVLPYLVIWFLGLTAAAYVRLYQRYSPGIIYREAIQRLGRGLYAIIIASLLIQLLAAVSGSLAHLGLGQILLVLYALILIYALGHVLVAAGARKLAAIEEVT